MTDIERAERIDNHFDSLPRHGNWKAKQWLCDWYFGQDELWITHDGDAVPLSAMSRDVALECLLFMDRVHAGQDSDDMPYSYRETELWRALKKRTMEVEV